MENLQESKVKKNKKKQKKLWPEGGGKKKRKQFCWHMTVHMVQLWLSRGALKECTEHYATFQQEECYPIYTQVQYLLKPTVN